MRVTERRCLDAFVHFPSERFRTPASRGVNILPVIAFRPCARAKVLIGSVHETSSTGGSPPDDRSLCRHQRQPRDPFVVMTIRSLLLWTLDSERMVGVCREKPP